MAQNRLYQILQIDFIGNIIEKHWRGDSYLYGFKEMSSFTGARIFTELLSIGMMNFALWIHFNDVAMKVIANIVVIIVNYIFSKLIIFKKK